jgi:hypothetical protein
MLDLGRLGGRGLAYARRRHIPRSYAAIGIRKEGRADRPKTGINGAAPRKRNYIWVRPTTWPSGSATSASQAFPPSGLNFGMIVWPPSELALARVASMSATVM